MQRVRMSLPYYLKFGWEVEVVSVDEAYVDLLSDQLLLEGLPTYLKVYKVSALPKHWTTKVGLGSIALRSLWFYKKKINQLLENGKFDLIYFSTTQFPVCILGAYWKKKFGIPYVIDFQDPWHSDYYLNKPKHQRPPKYWFSYRLNKYLEPIAMKLVDGLITVSQRYVSDLKQRYVELRGIPVSVITFGYSEVDLKIANRHASDFANLLSPIFRNVVYIGRGGADMHAALTPVFKALKSFLDSYPEFANKIKLNFIGTSYAPTGSGRPSIKPLAEQLGIATQVVEITDRINYYHTLATLQQADALLIPGSDDPKYTASKIYPYLLTNKPLLAVFHPESPALKTLQKCGAGNAYSYISQDLQIQLHQFFAGLMAGTLQNPNYNQTELQKYSALTTTRLQCNLFDEVIKRQEK